MRMASAEALARVIWALASRSAAASLPSAVVSRAYPHLC